MTDSDNARAKAVPVSLEDVRAAHSGPAVSVNRFISIPMSGGFRVSFLEYYDEAYSPEFRSAIFLSHQDMVSLRDLLTAQIERVFSAGENPSGSGEA